MAVGLVLVLYQVLWNLPYARLLGTGVDWFPALEPVAAQEYRSLILSAGVKLLAAAAALAVLAGSRTSPQALGLQVRIPDRPWLSWGLPLTWAVLVAFVLKLALDLDAPYPSSRPDEPALSRPLVLTTLLFRQVLNPLTEEIVFRGFVYLTLRRRLGAGFAIAASSLLFAAVHYNGGLHQMTVAFVVGMLLTWIYERTRSLPQAYFCHASLNTSRLLLALQRGHL
jgi:membrane protease YdiL (CAAX protease family)